MFFFFFLQSQIRQSSYHGTRPPSPPISPLFPNPMPSIHPSLLFRFGVVLQEVGCEPLHGVLWPRFHQSCQTVYQQGDHSVSKYCRMGKDWSVSWSEICTAAASAEAPCDRHARKEREKFSVSGRQGQCCGNGGGVAYLVVRVLLRLWGSLGVVGAASAASVVTTAASASMVSWGTSVVGSSAIFCRCCRLVSASSRTSCHL